MENKQRQSLEETHRSRESWSDGAGYVGLVLMDVPDCHYVFIVWPCYQGDNCAMSASNCAQYYQCQFPAMVDDWQRTWKKLTGSLMTFLFVGLFCVFCSIKFWNVILECDSVSRM